MSGTGRSPLRVAFVSLTHPDDPAANAGMPCNMARVLAGRFEGFDTFSPYGGTGMPEVESPRALSGRLGNLEARLRRRFLTFDGAFKHVEKLSSARAQARTLRKAGAYAEAVRGPIQAGGYDAAFGCIASWPMLGLSAHLPAVFYTDSTPAILNQTYRFLQIRSAGFHRANNAIETQVYSECQAVGFAADVILQSAMTCYGLDPSRGHVVPMGANVLPDVPLESTDHLDVPSRRDLRLCLVASDPVRKRTDFAVEVVEALAARGIGARLALIGPATDRVQKSTVVDHLGRLKLSDPADRRRHQETLASSHLMILPSTGEGAAIAPGEAAHFGRPSIVSDVVGLPTVVRHGETGLVMPLVTSTVADYADAIERLVDDPSEYRRLSAGALERAHTVLSWDRWADRIVTLIEQAAAAR